MWSRSRNAFAFRRRTYWSRLAAGATGGWVDLGVCDEVENLFCLVLHALYICLLSAIWLFYWRSSWNFGEDSFRILVFSSLYTFSVSTSSRHALFSSWKLTNVQNVYDCLYAWFRSSMFVRFLLHEWCLLWGIIIFWRSSTAVWNPFLILKTAFSWSFTFFSKYSMPQNSGHQPFWNCKLFLCTD